MRAVRKRMAVGVVMLTAAGGGAVALAPPGTCPANGCPAACPATGVVPAAATLDAPARPEAAVSLDWSGPPAATLNKPAEYTLSVRNLSAQPAQKTVVQVRAPRDASVRQTAPAAKVVDGVYVWDLGTLEPRSATHLKLTVAPVARGEMGCQAWVTFTGTSGMTVAVREPRVVVKVSAPEAVTVGDTFKVTYTVKNVGDAPAENVRHMLGVDAAAALDAAADCKKLTTLNPGEEWTETADVKAERGGRMVVSAAARGWGAADAATAEAAVRVQVPKLTTTVTGPAAVLVGRKATYRVRVENTGDVPITMNGLRWDVPAGWKVDGQGKADGRTFFPGTIIEAEFDAVPMAVGTGTVTAEATGSQATKSLGTCQTAVNGIAALRMELVDTVDPVEKGGQTTYEVRVTNTGTMADENVVLSCPLPEHFKLVAASGPVGYAVRDLGTCTVVKFDPVRELHPKTDVLFKVTVKAAAAGDVRFKAHLTSKHLSTSVAKEESTRVYGD